MPEPDLLINTMAQKPGADAGAVQTSVSTPDGWAGAAAVAALRPRIQAPATLVEQDTTGPAPGPAARVTSSLTAAFASTDASQMATGLLTAIETFADCPIPTLVCAWTKRRS